MITIFHFISFIGCLSGLIVGAFFGKKFFGWTGAFVGSVACAYSGLLLGRLLRLAAASLLLLHDVKVRKRKS